MKVLVLDDSPLVSKRLRASLSALPDIELLDGAGDPIEAIRLVRELRPDAVIMDIKTHRRFGIDILRNIKKSVPASLVVALTNKLYPESWEKCMKDEVDFSFDKFTEMDKVSALIADAQAEACTSSGI
jgi:DNA-binding NarL/FixJ family response regulator